MLQEKNRVTIGTSNTAAIVTLGEDGKMQEMGLVFTGKSVNVLGKFRWPLLSENLYYALTRDYYLSGAAVLLPAEGQVDDFRFFEPGQMPHLSAPAPIQELYWSEQVYDLAVMNWGIGHYGIVDKFWKKGFRGEGIRVAVIDSGVKADHPGLAGRLLRDENGRPLFSNWTGLGPASDANDENGHGTKCTGIIAACGQGCFGVAPRVGIMAAKIYNQEELDLEKLSKAIKWAVDNKADIISMSLEKRGDEETVYPHLEELMKIAEYATREKGILLVAAAGNSNLLPVSCPGCLESALTVGGYDDEFYRVTSNNIKKVDLLAPGEKILTFNTNSVLENFSDSSAATAFVSGLAALLLQYKRAEDKSYRPFLLKDFFLSKKDTDGRLRNTILTI